MRTAAGLALLLSLAACLVPPGSAPPGSAPPGSPPVTSPVGASYPVVVAPRTVEQMRISGQKLIVPDDVTKTEIARAKIHKLVTTYKLCIGVDGVPTEVRMLKSSGFAGYDARIQSEMLEWRYRPYTVEGAPRPVCTSVTFIYQQNADERISISLAFTPPRPSIVLLFGGEGLRAPLRMQPSLIGKQRIQVTSDWKSGTTVAGGKPKLNGGTTVVLAGTSKATKVRPDGSILYHTSIDHSELRTDREKLASGFLVGLAIDGLVSSTGVHGKTMFTMQDAPWQDEENIKSLQSDLATWPLLPEEPITVGAQWEVTTTETVAALPLTSVTRYTLVSRTPTTATLVGVIKLAGADQTLKDQELRAITGTGRIEATLEKGRVYPKLERTLHLDFTIKRAQAEQGSQAAQISAQVSFDTRVTLEPK
jgi:hypothetical protein